MYQLIVHTRFAAAHRLRNYKGKCENLHGHNYKIEVYVSSNNLNSQGMVMDFKELKKYLNEVVSKLDHQYLNDLSFFQENNPSAENIARFIYKKLKEKLPDRVSVDKVICWEEENSGAAYFEEK